MNLMKLSKMPPCILQNDILLIAAIYTIILSVDLLSVVFKFVVNSECRYPVRRYTECRGAH
jgi:hypothetical protein